MKIVRLIQKKLPLTLVSALLSGMIVAISVPTTATALAPVGVANENAAGLLGVPTNLGVATINGGMPGDTSASAIAVTDKTATAVGRSIGLVALSDIATGTRTATVRTSGVLSLYWFTATTVAVSANAGAFTSNVSAIASTTITTSLGATSNATAVAFTLAASGTANTMSTLWTAPSTAGTYYIYARHALSNPGGTAAVPTALAPTTGTAFAGITVTVVDNTTHPAAGGTNAVDISAATNSSLFVAVASSTGPTAVIHPVTTLGVGEASAFSKGLLAKNNTVSTAQTATVLAGGVLSLYGVVSTAVAFSATGGTFSSSQAGISDEAVTYNSSNSVSVITGMTPLTGSTGVATLWTAPTTAGTYTISMLTGWVQDANATTYSLPSTSSLPPTLGAKITVSVVASSAGGSYSAVYSACNTATTTTTTSSTYPTGVDSTGRVADGGAWYIDFKLRDGYDQALDPGNIVATATNGALVNIGTTSGTAPVAGTATTAVMLTSGANHNVIITQPTAGAPVTTTVTISYNGTTVCTKTVTIRGKVAKLTVANVGTQKLSGTTTGSQHWMGAELGIFNDSLFTVVASDSAGNLVSTPATYGTYSADAATLTTTVQGMAVTTRSSSASSTADERFNFGTWYCGATAGSASVKLKFTIAGTGDVITSDAFTARCADSPYTFTAALDRSEYIQGDIATVTLQFLDSKGNKANNVAAIGAGTFVLPMMTQIDDSASASAVTNADGTRVIRFSVAASGAAVTAGTYTGTISYAALAAAATATPTYKISTGSTDVAFSEILKSVVALIASINKQIQALQKLILSRKR